jgi:hypothetical protein
MVGQKGYFTGKRVTTREGRTYTIGKISGWHGNGEPVYDLIVDGHKVGELGNEFIKKYRKDR